MTDDEEGWLPLASRDRGSRFRDGLGVTLPAFGLSFYGFGWGLNAGEILGSPGFVRLALALAFAAAPIAAASWIWMLLNPVPFVNFDRERLRIRGRTIGLADVDVARYLGNFGNSSPAVTRKIDQADRLQGLRIGQQNGLQVSVFFHPGDVNSIGAVHRDRLAEVIRRSSIRYPTDPYDPTGRFSHYNFPENLDKEAALAFVLGDADPSDPPVAGDEPRNDV